MPSSSHLSVLFLLVAILGAIIATCHPRSARSQQPSSPGLQAPSPGADQHHDFHRDFYRYWLQPGTNKSCCNARVTAFGHVIGDCEPTQAEIRNGAWFAWNRIEGRWLRIPENRILRERNPSGQDAHLCWTPEQGVICFVPPDTGG